METFTMTIDGKAVSAETTLKVVNPATEQVFANAPDCGSGQLEAALNAAQRAFRPWSCNEEMRREVLRRCADVVQAHLDELARLLTQEQGKPLAKAIGEITLSARWFAHTAALDIPVQVLQDDAQAYIELQRKPIGIVGAITPWNYPIILAVCKIAPALLAGNTVVLKPSPFTPLTTLKLGDLLRAVVPPGVLNVVSGGDTLGALLSQHPAVNKISFTGSIETGKKVAAAAAPDLKRLTLELGGNDPAIVLPDARPQQIAEQLFWGAFENSGQFCAAIKRLYVHETVFQPLLDEMSVLARSVKVGNGLDSDTQLGPLNNRMQLERVIDLVNEAKKAGATIVTGGEPLSQPGYFYPPTLLTDIADDTRIVAEEQFGPALPILVYRDVEEAIERANRTQYGLGGSVWSSDVKRAAEIARQLECGTAWVNQHCNLLPNVPFGGVKWSGIGVEYGIWGLLDYTRIQVVNIAKA